MENQKFEVELENGEVKLAELLTIVCIDGKDYAIYMVPNDEGNVDILSSYVLKDEEGYDKLVDIDDEEDKQKVIEFIGNLLS
jgi:hypothetical protein